MADNGGVITSGLLADAAWPLVVFGGLLVMIILLRWAFTPGRSLVARVPVAGAPDNYGLLTTVAEPGNFIEGEKLRRMLEDAGIRATLAPTTAGPRLMVFPDDAGIARALLAAGPPPPKI